MDRLLIVCLAVALLVAIVVIWLYPLPATRKQLGCDKSQLPASASDAGSTGSTKPSPAAAGSPSVSVPPQPTTVAETLTVIRQQLAQHLPDGSALQNFTYERFSELYRIYTKYKANGIVNDGDLKQVCMDHVSQWRFDHKLQLLRKFRMYLQAYQTGAADP